MNFNQPIALLAMLICVGFVAVANVAAQDADHANEVELAPPDVPVDDEHAAEHVDADHGDAHGSHADAPLLGFDIGSAIVNILIFLFVFAVLTAFVWPNVLHGLKARETKIRSDLEAAEAANAKAEGLLQQYQVKLDDAAQQVQTMLADARHDAEATGRRIVDESKQEAARQQERALADIQTAKKVALSEIAGQTSDIAMKLAGNVVGRELKQDDHQDLIRQSLDRLPSQN